MKTTFNVLHKNRQKFINENKNKKRLNFFNLFFYASRSWETFL